MKRFILSFTLVIIAMAAGAQNWYQLGIKVGTQIPLVRQYSDDDYLVTLRTPQVAFFFRAGMYVYGEVGIGYQYFRSRFEATQPNGEVLSDFVETRYLVLPFKAVGDVPITKKISFMPFVGVLYQPLLHVSENLLGYSKKNIENHWALLTTGFDFKFGFISLGVDYRYSFQNYFKNKDGKKPQYIGITVAAVF